MNLSPIHDEMLATPVCACLMQHIFLTFIFSEEHSIRKIALSLLTVGVIKYSDKSKLGETGFIFKVHISRLQTIISRQSQWQELKSIVVPEIKKQSNKGINDCSQVIFKLGKLV